MHGEDVKIVKEEVVNPQLKQCSSFRGFAWSRKTHAELFLIHAQVRARKLQHYYIPLGCGSMTHLTRSFLAGVGWGL